MPEQLWRQSLYTLGNFLPTVSVCWQMSGLAPYPQTLSFGFCGNQSKFREEGKENRRRDGEFLRSIRNVIEIASEKTTSSLSAALMPETVVMVLQNAGNYQSLRVYISKEPESVVYCSPSN
jgi:hypothetical protein